MKTLFLFTYAIIFRLFAFSQKPVIDSSVYGKWPSVTMGGITNNGKFATYFIENFPIGENTSVLQAIGVDWKIEIPGSSLFKFTWDSRMAIFTKPNDSLGIINLKDRATEFLTHVRSFKLSGNNFGEWLAYQVDSFKKGLILRNLKTNNERFFLSVTDYNFSEDGKMLFMQGDSKNDTGINFLIWTNLANGSIKTLWQWGKIDNIVYDTSSSKLAFTVEDEVDGVRGNSFWYCSSTSDKATLLVDKNTAGLDSNLQLDRIREV